MAYGNTFGNNNLDRDRERQMLKDHIEDGDVGEFMEDRFSNKLYFALFFGI